jgi:hypothetical protein
VEKIKSKIGWYRVIAAVLLSFLFLAMLVPNADKIVAGPSTIAVLAGVLLVPLSLIYLGAKGIGLPVLEYIGWAMLVVLVALATKQFDR